MTFAERYAQAVAERPELRTGRLHLRRPGEADIPATVAVCGLREVAFRLGRVPHPYAESDARFFFDTIVPNELVWGIFERDGATLIGMIGLHLIGDDREMIELGYYLAPEHWRGGLMTEAGAVVTAFGLALAAPGGFFAGYSRTTRRRVGC